MCTVKPKPLGPRRIIMGGFRLVTSGDSSRQGEVSRDEAVLEPPPPVPMLPLGDCMPAEILQSCCANCALSTVMKKKNSFQKLRE